MSARSLTGWCIAICILLSSSIPSTHAQDETGEPSLQIGSVGPPLDIEHWVQGSAGGFKPVTKFEDNKVYVVEFWATWCGPCVASMPHLSGIQKEYKDKNVQIVSISDEDLETVEKFLERKVPGDDEQTFQDLTKNYCLTTDPDQSAYNDYMRAAGRNGIPCAFLVGKTGRIEWIGHPMSMDEPLAAVVNGTWDAEKFAAEFREEQEMNIQKSRVSRLLRGATAKEQIGIVNDELAKAKGTFRTQLKQLKFNLLMTAGETDALAAMAKDILSDTENPESVNNFAWNAYRFGAQGRIKDMSVFDSIVVATEKAANEAKGKGKAMVLDTLAHIHHLRGDLEQAIKVQQEAMAALGDEEVEGMREFLDKLLKEQKSK